jgi:hypothetical protein
MKKFLFLFAFASLPLTATFSQTADELIAKISNQLCDSLSVSLAKKEATDLETIKSLEASAEDLVLYGVAKKEVEILATLLIEDLPIDQHPYEQAIKMVLQHHQKNCSVYQQILKSELTQKASFKMLGDSICGCLNITATDVPAEMMRAIVEESQRCFMQMSKNEKIISALKKDFDSEKNIQALPYLTNNYLLSQCDKVAGFFVEARFQYFRSRHADFFNNDRWYNASTTLSRIVMGETNLSDKNCYLDAEAYQQIKPYLAKAVEVTKGRLNRFSDQPIPPNRTKVKGGISELRTYTDGQKIYGQIEFLYAQNAFGKIRSVRFIGRDEIKDIEKLEANLEKFSPPPGMEMPPPVEAAPPPMQVIPMVMPSAPPPPVENKKTNAPKPKKN